MILEFSMNYVDELITLVLDEEYNVTEKVVHAPGMCSTVFKCGVPVDTKSLKHFFHKNMGGEEEIKVYIDHIRKHGFYNPYERNLRILLIEEDV